MMTLDHMPPEARAEAVRSIREILGTPDAIITALQVVLDMVRVWGIAPQDALDLVAALYREARGAA